MKFNKGWVNVGISSDTAAFAVASIRGWWENEGKNDYQNAESLYITANGGSSSSNSLWKSELQKFANDSGLTVYVSRFPSATSKRNKIEHRLFSYISTDWRGKPLTSSVVILSLIGGTKTETGLTVKAKLDENKYETGIKITDEEFAKLNLYRNGFHGERNYKIVPD